MYFVTGGAFNGKSGWVKAYNGISEKNSLWLSAYQEDVLPDSLDILHDGTVVLEGVEQWVKALLTVFNAVEVRQKWQLLLKEWLIWEESQQGRVIILIGSDITKGIVPIEASERMWRDVTGRVFQDTVSVCERVDLIWYGINQRLK
ncbi:bifunctional adenosylcobinamide kinase/adenosylcobinamide-phosphate guanylyltransferase [Bacillus sp. V3B]|uniref:bifunctional adenosylcobinamide kinase/adenosylcobinamide-phosphate guanylyltransferase n=1 Tax=Bacillus sp. V3B TaxID=2804915 RepID=UPI00210AC244|nr:bifunctional adenosylcobinamide kinase/adenosylcobinamide-phosphate guanylyltransferase [Bacillus sp. V3B]MCQ6276944.1 bifunctional adenosylcobinamide kinase/adenosylcobinamide-phosphate guanylyltransferase [Bacillus sp. V3B]